MRQDAPVSGDDQRSHRVGVVAAVAGAAIVLGVTMWLAIGADSSLHSARDACHQRVRADRALPSDATFSDSEARATGDAVVVRGNVRSPSSPAVTYSCTVRKGTAGSFDVRIVTEGGAGNAPGP